MIIAMGDNLIGQVLDQIQQRLTSTWEWLWDPLWQWYAIGGLIFVICAVIAFFLQFKWIRAGLGLFLLFVGTFIAGGYQMRKHYKQRLDEERAKLKALQQQQRETRDTGTDGGWFRW
jgi:hypothetical protein